MTSADRQKRFVAAHNKRSESYLFNSLDQSAFEDGETFVNRLTTDDRSLYVD